MKRKVLLGAPSSTGKGAKELIIAAFAGAAFPLEITLENKVGRAFSLPEVGVFLEPCTNSGHCKTVTIRNADALQRLGSTIEQLGFLNNIQELIAIEADVGEDGDSDPDTGGNQNPDDDDPDAGKGEDGDSGNGEQGSADSKNQKPAGKTGKNKG
jgi:hypothetical protein